MTLVQLFTGTTKLADTGKKLGSWLTKNLLTDTDYPYLLQLNKLMVSSVSTAFIIGWCMPYTPIPVFLIGLFILLTILNLAWGLFILWLKDVRDIGVLSNSLSNLYDYGILLWPILVGSITLLLTPWLRTHW